MERRYRPEYIRIPTAMIPERVRKFYALDQYITSHAIYLSVHRTHYGLPQAGALFKPAATIQTSGAEWILPMSAYTFLLQKQRWFCKILTRCGRLRYTMDEQAKHGPFHRDTITTIIFGQNKLGMN